MSSTGVGSQSNVVTDMDEHGIQGDMKGDAMNVAAAALEAHQEEKDISKYIKTHFDNKYGPCWHCIVGSDFRAFVTHEAKNFIFFYVGKTAICLYKSG
jgi:dynein light chain LC8-type